MLVTMAAAKFELFQATDPRRIKALLIIRVLFAR